MSSAEEIKTKWAVPWAFNPHEKYSNTDSAVIAYAIMRSLLPYPTSDRLFATEMRARLESGGSLTLEEHLRLRDLFDKFGAKSGE